ncbi:MAG: hypothetical protein LBL87_02560 [Ruminococcus sp.]|jgi:hypothetical protein|nr:hypothetical protein [Ruminococcus sp.]
MPQYGYSCRAVTVHEPPMPLNLNAEHACVKNGTAKIPATCFEHLSPEEAKMHKSKANRKSAKTSGIFTPPNRFCVNPPLFTFAGKSFDKESVLVLALAAILLREKADIKLILALVYLAF